MFFSLLLVTSAYASLASFSQSGCQANYTGALSSYQKVISPKCFARPSTGTCDELTPSFFYNPATNQCLEDPRGGCDDGCVGFETSSECESSCIKAVAQPSGDQRSFKQEACTLTATSGALSKYEHLPATCFVTSMTGKCRARFISFHFDAASGQCVQGIYGGCPDGCQAFPNEKACKAACHKPAS
ncbi:Kunitz-type protease inhibitor 1 [Entomophthora muscae]|uniref:Kunitz-type protease inhibitor 1 n=1 Tax=Entomophthora muscae TaxID=34485 RepID=A0ACC2TJS9_9FUNG|nr:Kunitz-type protease inhibitor 1 [Entomophthora muscae]